MRSRFCSRSPTPPLLFLPHWLFFLFLANPSCLPSTFIIISSKCTSVFLSVLRSLCLFFSAPHSYFLNLSPFPLSLSSSLLMNGVETSLMISPSAAAEASLCSLVQTAAKYSSAFPPLFKRVHYFSFSYCCSEWACWSAAVRTRGKCFHSGGMILLCHWMSGDYYIPPAILPGGKKGLFFHWQANVNGHIQEKQRHISYLCFSMASTTVRLKKNTLFRCLYVWHLDL